MTKNEAIERCDEFLNNEKRKRLIEKRLIRLENMIREDMERESEKKSLVDRFRDR